jgi:trigger factor
MKLLSCKKCEDLRYEVRILIEPDEFVQEIKEVYAKRRKSFSVPGFRKGKAPFAFVKKHYGNDIFYEESIKKLYPYAINFAIKTSEKKLMRSDNDMGEIVKADEKEGVEIKALMNGEPEVNFKNDWKGIKIPAKERIITDEDVNKEVEKFIKHRPEIIPAENRISQSGDMVNISFEGIIDGKKFESGSAENVNLKLGSGRFIPGFEEQIIGHSKEENFDVNVVFPENYRNKNAAGKKAVFKVKLNSVSESKERELNDKNIDELTGGQFKTVVEFKEKTAERMRENEENRYENTINRILTEKLLENAEVKIPEVLVLAHVNAMLEEVKQNMKQYGMTIEDYFKFTNSNEEALKQSLRPEAENHLKLILVLNAIAKDAGISVSDEKLDEEYKNIANANRITVEKVKEIANEEELKEDLMLRLALEEARSKAIIEEPEEESGKNTEENSQLAENSSAESEKNENIKTIE